jgi:hypothetical protein
MITTAWKTRYGQLVSDKSRAINAGSKISYHGSNESSEQCTAEHDIKKTYKTVLNIGCPQLFDEQAYPIGGVQV